MIEITCQVSAVQKQEEGRKILLRTEDTSSELPTGQTMTVYFRAPDDNRVLTELTHQELAVLEHAKNVARLQVAVNDAEDERKRLEKENQDRLHAVNTAIKEKRQELSEALALQEAPNSVWRQYLESLTVEES